MSSSSNPPRNDSSAAGSTTGTGAPAISDRNSLTLGPNGPILLHDVHLLEQLAHFNREKVPERQPHAKGAGAFGVLEITEDVSRYTRAALFRKGAQTDMLARFSTVAGESGSPDTWRDVRGFSLKFYTDEGNYDLVGNNTDRKSGHVLISREGQIQGIDHGLMFHHEFKLRTVIWEFGGEPIAVELLEAIERLVEGDLPDGVACRLDVFERDALRTRGRAVVEAGCFPIDGTGRRYPWPLV